MSEPDVIVSTTLNLTKTRQQTQQYLLKNPEL